MLLGLYLLAADMPASNRLWATIDARWTGVEILIDTGVTNARTEAANTGIKHIKRTRRGYRNPAHYALVSCSPVPPETRHERRFQRGPTTPKREEPLCRRQTKWKSSGDSSSGPCWSAFVSERCRPLLGIG